MEHDGTILGQGTSLFVTSGACGLLLHLKTKLSENEFRIFQPNQAIWGTMAYIF
jgi:hypothetical protein